jgi:hypothetical protein
MAEQFNVNNPGADLNDIDNSPLVEAIEKMRENYTDEARDDVLNKVIFDTTFFVPAIFDSSTELKNENDRLRFSERPKAQFVLIENPEGEKYFPAFLTHDDVIAFREEQKMPCEAFLMTFADLAEIVEQQSMLKGFVVDPHGFNLPFPTEFVQGIKKTLIEQMDKLESEEKEKNKPDITMSTNQS